MKYLIGRNWVTSGEHFNISVYNLVDAGFNGKSVKSLFVHQIIPYLYSRTLSIVELFVIRYGLLYIPDFIPGDTSSLLCHDTSSRN